MKPRVRIIHDDYNTIQEVRVIISPSWKNLGEKRVFEEHDGVVKLSVDEKTKKLESLSIDCDLLKNKALERSVIRLIASIKKASALTSNKKALRLKEIIDDDNLAAEGEIYEALRECIYLCDDSQIDACIQLDIQNQREKLGYLSELLMKLYQSNLTRGSLGYKARMEEDKKESKIQDEIKEHINHIIENDERYIDILKAFIKKATSFFRIGKIKIKPRLSQLTQDFFVNHKNKKYKFYESVVLDDDFEAVHCLVCQSFMIPIHDLKNCPSFIDLIKKLYNKLLKKDNTEFKRIQILELLENLGFTLAHLMFEQEMDQKNGNNIEGEINGAEQYHRVKAILELAVNNDPNKKVTTSATASLNRLDYEYKQIREEEFEKYYEEEKYDESVPIEYEEIDANMPTFNVTANKIKAYEKPLLLFKKNFEIDFARNEDQQQQPHEGTCAKIKAKDISMDDTCSLPKTIE